MSEKSFVSELERASMRPDIDELRRKLAVHHHYSVEENPGLKPEWDDDCDDVISSGTEDPEQALAYVVLTAATYDDADYLGLMAAGPLEDILLKPDAEMLERVVVEARKSARFRWMLSGVWLHAIHPGNVEAIRNAVGDISMDRDDALPPRPWA